MNPRVDRDMDRGRRAADAVRMQGGSAMDAALAQIEATFSKAAIHNRLKLNVDRVLRRPLDHRATIARYSARAVMLQNLTIETAMRRVDAWIREEERAFGIASALGRGNRLSLDVIEELRLLLRFARSRITERQFSGAVLRIALRASYETLST